MAQDTWLSTSGGDFATAADWSTGTVPGASDNALFTKTGSYTVTSEANETVNSVQMVQGVTLAINGGTFQMTAGSGTGTDNGLISVNGGNTLVVGGTLAGTGTVSLNTNGYNADLVLDTATTTLSGGGKVVMSDAYQNRIYAATAGGILNNVSDTISGSGQIGLGQTGLDNQSAGIIDATGTNNNLVLDFGAYTATNAGLIEATGPAGLQIQNGTLTQTGTGSIKAVGAGHNVNLSNETIRGGTLATSGGGVIQSINNATLSALTITAGSTIEVAGSTILDLANTITNKGTLFLNTNGYNADLVATTGVTTLTGAGSVVMSDSGNNRIYDVLATDKLVNVNNTISGSGQLGIGTLTLDNQAAGVINSNGTTGLTIDLTAFTNEGLVEDTNTGSLGIIYTDVVNTGTIEATGVGSAVNLAGNSVITGGTLLTTLGGVIQTTGYASLDGSTSTGVITIAAGSDVNVTGSNTLYLDGSIVNHGTLSLNTNGYNSDLIANSATVTLSGGGAVIMSDSGNNRIFNNATTDTIVNVDNIISGSGQIGVGYGGSFDNQAGGTVDSNGTTGLTLFINTTNEGLIEDTGIGGLGIQSSLIVNSATIGAFGAGATVNIYNGTTLQGGALATSGGGYFFVGNYATLDGATKGAITLTAGSNFDIINGNTLTVLGTFVNDGTFNSESNGYNADFIIGTPTLTLTGGGKYVMNDQGANRIYGAAGTDELINVNNTISGSGQIGANQMALDNQAAGVIDATGTAAGITLFLGSFSNEGLVEDTGPGGVVIQSTTVVNTGTIAAFGSATTVNLYNGSSIEGGTVSTTHGGIIETGNYGTLDGATNGALTLTAGSVMEFSNGTTLYVDGTIINNGTVELNSNGYNDDLIANTATVTLTGGGTVLMNDVAQNRIYGAASTDKLINVNNTISGSGQIGANQLTLDNQKAGVIDATGTAAGLTIYTTAFTNEGLVEDTNTGGIGIQTSTIVNTGTIAAFGAGTSVNLYNGATIEGGTMATTGGGIFEDTNYASLDGMTAGAVTLATGSLFDITAGNTLYAEGTILNRGTISQASNGYNNDFIVNSATVTLAGTGSVVMSDTYNNRIYGAATADKLVNAGNTISGSGQLGANQLTLDNQKAGTIDATGATTQLNIELSSTFTNEGLVEASGTAGLVIQNATLTNTGIIASLSDSSVNILSTTTITNFSAGTLTSGTWEAISAGGANTSTLTIPTGPITVDDAHLVISGVGASIVAGGTSVVTSITTIGTTGELDIQNGATFATTNSLAVSGTILLSGSLSAAAITTTTKGLISANGGLGTVSTTGRLLNNGTLQATTGGTLSIAGGSLDNVGTVVAQAGGILETSATERVTNYVSGTLTGGTWAAIGNAATLSIGIGVITVDAATVTLSGPGSSIRSGSSARQLDSSLTTVTAAGVLNVLNSRGFSSGAVAGLTDNGIISLGGSKFTASGVTIASGATFQGGGTLASTVTDNGLLASSAAPLGSNGTLSVTGAISGTGLLSATAATTLNTTGGYAVGTISVAAGATFTGAGSASGAVTVAGTLAVGSTGTLSAGTLTVQSTGLVSGPSIIASGAIADSGIISLAGGTLSGSSISVATSTADLMGYGTVVQDVANTGTIEAAGGTLTLSAGESGGTVLADASATLATQALSANRLTIAAGGNFIGAGTSAIAVDAGTLTASGGLLTLTGASGSGTAVIASGATLDSTSTLTISGLSFGTGSSQTLALATPSGNTSLISNWGGGDTIDLLNTVVTAYTYGPGVGLLTLKDGSTAVGTLSFTGSYTRANFSLASDGHGGTDVLFVASAAVPTDPMTDLQSAVAASTGSAQAVGLATPAPAPAALPTAPSLGGSFDLAAQVEQPFDVHFAVQ
jgi:fibronectin-binding autotransporter adhesin